MQKKLFLQRNIRKGGGGGSYLKYLVFAAVCLVLLVLITPYFFKGKNKDITKRPMPDRATVTKEVPKAVEPLKTAEPVKPPEVATAPETVMPHEVQPPAKPPESEPNPVASQKEVQEAPIAPEKTLNAEPAPKDLFPKKNSSAEAPPAAASKTPAKQAAKPTGPAPAAKPPTAAGKGNYAVQVGTTFKNKPEAEALRKDLAKKGYSAVVRPAQKGSGYRVTTSPTVASKAYTLQEQMKIQGVSTTTVIKVAPGPEPEKKPASKKPNTQANGGRPQS